MHLIRTFKQLVITSLAASFFIFSFTSWAGVVIVQDPEDADRLSAFNAEKILSAVKSRFSRSGFMVYDQAALGQGTYVSGLNKEQLLVQSSRLAQDDPALKVIFIEMQTDLSKQKDGFISYTLSGDIYSVAGKSFVSSWSLPIQTISLPIQCQNSCFDSRLSEEMSRDSELLSKGLIQLLSVPSAHMSQSGSPIITFEMDLLDLTETETVQLVDLMRNEFPGFVEITSVRAQGPRQQFKYRTSASADKLREWLVISLSEIGLDPDTDIELIISDRRIDIRRYLPVSPLRPSPDKNPRFN